LRKFSPLGEDCFLLICYKALPDACTEISIIKGQFRPILFLGVSLLLMMSVSADETEIQVIIKQ
jgi:hypothetical protein